MDKSRLKELSGIKDVESGLVVELEKDTEANTNFRKVIYTTKQTQLVLMSLKPGEEIGSEKHTGDQFIRIDKGQAISVLNGKSHSMKDGDAVVIPAGIEHNIINQSKTSSLKIYAVYSPPEHKEGVVDKSKPSN